MKPGANLLTQKFIEYSFSLVYNHKIVTFLKMKLLVVEARLLIENLAEKNSDDLFYHLCRSLNMLRFKIYEDCPAG